MNFQLIDLSRIQSNKGEVKRVFESFKTRVTDYGCCNHVELNAKLVVNPLDSHLVNAKQIIPDIYISITKAALNNPNIDDLINRLRFFKFDKKIIDKILFVISNNDEVLVQNTNNLMLEKISIDNLFVETANKQRIKKWIERSHYLKNSAEGICIYGQSGVGKSACISAIANELKIPIINVDINILFSDKISHFENKINSIVEKTMILFDNFDVLFADLSKKEQVRYEMVSKRNSILKIFNNSNCIVAFTLSSIELLPLDFFTRISLFVKLDYPNTDVRTNIISRCCSNYERSKSLASKLNGFSTREIVSLMEKIMLITNSTDIGVISNEIIDAIFNDLLGNREDIFSPDGREYSISKPTETLDRVIIPAKDKETLMTALSSIINENLIYDTWGFRGIDPNVRSIINFFGPPGTGKTMCANAVANILSEYCNKPFELLSLKYSEIESMYVGEAPKKLERVFNYARNKNVVLFFDEADSFLGKRIQNISQGAEQAINSLRSTMLIQLEKFHGVVVFATNLASNYDSAFKTRFLAEIEFKLPTKKLCIEIFKKNIPLNILDKISDVEDNDWVKLGDVADGISGRDIKTIVWRVLANAARFDGVSHKFMIDDFINETIKYKEEKYPTQYNEHVKSDNIKVTSVSDEDKDKIKKIIEDRDNQSEP